MNARWGYYARAKGLKIGALVQPLIQNVLSALQHPEQCDEIFGPIPDERARQRYRH